MARKIAVFFPAVLIALIGLLMMLTNVSVPVSMAGGALGAPVITFVSPTSTPAPTTRYVAPGGNCGTASPCYANIQSAVDAAVAKEVIKVAAGTYNGIIARSGVTQVVYIAKSLSVIGGFTVTNWITSSPDNNPTTLDAQGNGRAMYVSLSGSPQALSLTGLNLINGNSTKGGGIVSNSGGGIAILGWSNGSVVTITNSRLISNNAATNGGGMYAWALTVTLTGNTIMNNHAQLGGDAILAQGGGVFLSTAPAIVSDNLFLSNTVPIGYYYGDSGGGLYSERAPISLLSNTFSGNQCAEGGGFTAFRSPATVTGNRFISNTASEGGGVYYGLDTDNSAIITLTHNLFSNNYASDGGGAWLTPKYGLVAGNIFRDNSAGHGGGLIVSSLTVEDNLFTRNNALLRGGGLDLAGMPVLNRNIIRNNSSNKGGGVGVSAFGNSNPILTNNVIADNTAVANGIDIGWGSAVYIADASMHLAHTTIARNSGGDGSGVYITRTIYAAEVVLTNTILVSQPVGITVGRSTTVTLDGVLWFGTSVTISAHVSATVNAAHLYTGNPLFDHDGYHILTGTLAIGNGVAAGVATDIDQQVRSNSRPPDIGADEWSLRYDIFVPIVMLD